MTMNDQQDAVRTTTPALVQRSQRGPEGLLFRTDQGVPAPGTVEYLIRVGAAGVNFADVTQTYGTYAGDPPEPGRR
jgi:NADPH:quinone reductase-like Zn-dependent oxidoreductase